MNNGNLASCGALTKMLKCVHFPCQINQYISHFKSDPQHGRESGVSSKYRYGRQYCRDSDLKCNPFLSANYCSFTPFLPPAR